MASGLQGLLDYEWACPNCTYMNKPGSFKCKVCLGPKGTATREVKAGVTQDQQYVTETYQSQVKLHKATIAKSLQSAAAMTKASAPTVPSSSSSSSTPATGSCSTSTSTAPSNSHLTTASNSSSTASSISSSSSSSNSSGSTKSPSSSKKRCRTKAATAGSTSSKLNKLPRLPDLDRSSSFRRFITVNSVQVLITEYDVF